MSWKRSAETWDSDDDILKDDNDYTSGVSAFPLSPEDKTKIDSDDDLDENALLYSDDNDSFAGKPLQGTKKSSNSTGGKIKLSGNKPKSWTKITPPSPERKTGSDGKKTFSKITGPSSQNSTSTNRNLNNKSLYTQVAEKDDEFGAVLEIDPEEDSLFDESVEVTESILNTSQDTNMADTETEVLYEEDLSQSNQEDLVVEDIEENSTLEETLEETFEKPSLSDSESESDEEEKGRGRFKTERSISKNVAMPAVVKAKPRDAIPDTLEISEEQQAQIEEFMTHGKGGRGRGRGRGGPRRGGVRGGGPQNRYQPYQQQPPPSNQQAWPNQGPPNEMQAPSQYPYPQQITPQQSAPPYQQEPLAVQPLISHPPVSMPPPSNAPLQMPPATVSQPQPRKILINPHFRGRSPASTASSHIAGPPVSGGSYTGPQMPAPHVVNSHQPQPLLAPHHSPQHNPSHVSGWPPHSQNSRPPYPVHSPAPTPQAGNFNPPYQGQVRPQHHFSSTPPSSMYQGSQPHPHHPGPQPLMQTPPTGHPFGGPHHRGPAPYQGDPRMPASNASHQQYPPQQNTGFHMHRPAQHHPQSLMGAPPGMPYQPSNNQHFNPGGPHHHRAPPPPHVIQNNQPRGHGPQHHSGPPRMQQRMPPPTGHQPRPLMSQNFQSQMRPHIRHQNSQQLNTKSKVTAQALRIQSQKLKERAKKFKQQQHQQQQNLKAVPSDSGVQSISTVINRVGQKRPSTDTTDSSPTKVAKQVNVDPETQRLLDEQKKRREAIVKMKEERRQAQAAQKRKQLEEKLKSQGLTIEDVESGKTKPDGQGQTNPTKTPPLNQQPVVGLTEQVQWRYGAPINQTRPAGLKPLVQQGVRMQRPQVNRGQGPRPQGPRNQNPQSSAAQQQGPRLSGPKPQQTSPKSSGQSGQQMTGRLVNPPISAANQNNNAPIGEGMVRRKKVTILKKNAKGEVIDRKVIWKPFNENESTTGSSNTAQRSIVNNKPAPETASSNAAQRTVVNNKPAPETASSNTAQRTVVNNKPAPETASSNTAQRTVVANASPPERVVMRSGSTGAQRKIVDNQPRRIVMGGETPGLKTVVINNLSASTPEVKLRSMAEEIGPLEDVKQFKSSKKAHITFTNPKHAGDFVKKYHRHLIDLSTINVALLT